MYNRSSKLNPTNYGIPCIPVESLNGNTGNTLPECRMSLVKARIFVRTKRIKSGYDKKKDIGFETNLNFRAIENPSFGKFGETTFYSVFFFFLFFLHSLKARF